MTRTIEDARVTVVVASRERRDDLLDSLPRHRAPVVYIDNASADGSAEAVRASMPDVEVVRLAGNAGAHARTLGAERARTPFVAFADDDSWWSPGSLAAAAGVLAAHPEVGLVAARILVGPAERLDPLCEEMARSPLPDAGRLPGTPVLGFAACAVMVRREAFLGVGGFDRVVRFPGEEERLALDLAAAGWQLRYLGESGDVVVHHHPSPRRDGAAERRAAMTRARVLTAVMRLPWSAVLRRAREAWQAGGSARAGLLGVRDGIVPALRDRRVTTAEVLRWKEMLDGVPARASARIGEGGRTV